MNSGNGLCIAVVFLFCFVFVPDKSFAQHFKGGPLIGINASQVDGDTYYGYNKPGLMLGAFISTPVSKTFDAQLELKYMGKGAHKAATEEDLTSYTSHLHYIEMPLLLKLNTKYKVFVEGGLALGYLFSHSEEDENGTIDPQYEPKFNKVEFSYLLGIGYSVSDHISVNLRYSYSILPIIDYPHSPNARFFYRGAYNNLFSIGAYYMF